MEEKTYLVINTETDEIVNRIIWNGVDFYEIDVKYKLVEYVPPIIEYIPPEPTIPEIATDTANTTS
jgi:hypothetical protein